MDVSATHRGAVVAMAVLLAVAASTTALRLGRAAEGDPRTTPPPVVRADDAVRPVAGRDYTLLRTLGRSEAARTRWVTDSGEILLWGTAHRPEVLLDPRTGRQTTVPTGQVLEATRARVLTTDVDRRTETTVVRMLDRRASARRVVRIPPVRGRHLYPLGLAGGRIWWARSVAAESSSVEVYSSIIGGHSVRAEGEQAGFAADDDLMVTVRPRSPRTVWFRDLSSGRTRSVLLPAGCGPLPATTRPLWTNGAQAVVEASCGGRADPRLLLDADGLIADLRVESDEGVVAMSDRTVSFFDYVYDLTAKRLYRVSDHDYLVDPPPTQGPGRRPIGLWPQWRRHGNAPTSALVVRLR